jgi:integrase
MKWIRKNAPEDFCQYGLQFLGLRRAERLGLTWDKIEGLDTKNPKIVVSQQLARYETPEYPYILRKKKAIANQGWYIKEWTKTKKHRTIPVPEEFATMLREHRKRWRAEKKIWSGPERQELEAQYETWLNTGKRGNPPELDPPYDMGNLLFLHEDGSVITLNNDNEGWKKYLNLAGARQWRGHLNRHITATIFANLENPPSVQEMQDMLGHETTAMALYYAKIRERNLKTTLADYGKSLGFF